MTSERSYSDYLADIIDAMQKIDRFIEDFSEVQFQQDEKTIFAVVRALELSVKRQMPSQYAPFCVSADPLESHGGHARQVDPSLYRGRSRSHMENGNR